MNTALTTGSSPFFTYAAFGSVPPPTTSHAPDAAFLLTVTLVPLVPNRISMHSGAHAVFSARQAVLGFAFRQQARRTCQAESSSLSYGPVLHLPLLPTPLRSGAVRVGYGMVTPFGSGLAPL